ALPTQGVESGTAGALAIGIEASLESEEIARRLKARSARPRTSTQASRARPVIASRGRAHP
ncbi:MAG TPA: hypothetical protein VLR88_11620, partial [Propionibacteriaceae bacterium]|nr:hypothetical protein [Propionibacteriaceae bacterium]